MSSLEQRANIKFCVLLQKSPSETLAYDPQTKRQSSEWKAKPSPRKENFACTKSEGKLCWRCFSITIALFTTNLFLKAKLSIKNFTWRSLNDYELQSDENDLKNGQQTIGFFTRQCSTTSRSDCEKVPCQTQCYHSGTPSLFSRPSTSGFLPVSTAENEIEGKPFCGFR
ncbi:hypothetical protein AVEN_6591-1 [Araneus ventricosus]|uniref:Uncharacterized protein n=1 Tax=Araneus ventricosus TaxID=182803 RepID=A0A4Y2LMS4_ARAVE|nr:hypothetical protein AVEN_6591-1 [Araneus ventricosus]